MFRSLSDEAQANKLTRGTQADDLRMSPADREILRGLAGQVATLAARPIEAQKRGLWYRHNALEPTRPLIFCDPENGWHEIFTASDLACEGDLAREWEFGLRKEVFWGAQMQDDRVILPYFDVAHVYENTGWGVSAKKIGGDNGGAYTWDAPIKDYDRDFAALKQPQIIIDHEATARAVELAETTLGDLLTVRLKTSWWWTMGMTWTLVNLRGLTQLMYDFIDAPEQVHRIMAFLRDSHLGMLDFLEAGGLLSLNNDGTYVGSGGFGWSDELPQPDFSGTVRTMDMWGFAESQETVGVSPAMFEAFIFPYQRAILERFGLNCYGCCEPLDSRWHIVERLPRLRRVSVSPWADVSAMAERLGERYILSRKPSPTPLAVPHFDEEAIRANLRAEMHATRDCRVEFIMKDNHTIHNDPSRVIRWVQIAREEAESL